MKVFLVFLGLLLINVNFISYQGDLAHYLKLRAYLKSVAEACAAGSAQYYDETAYGAGRMVINRTEAERYTQYVTNQAAARLGLNQPAALAWQMVINDDSTLPPGDESPAVTVELTLATEDLFRLPAITVTEVRRSARYELARQ